MSSVIPGGYKLEDMEACPLPQQLTTAFSKITELLGAKYKPVLYVGTQVVHGVNHMILCKQTLSAEGAPEHLVKMVLNQKADSEEIIGSWELVNIEEIV